MQTETIGLNQVFYWQKLGTIYSAQLICDLFENFEVIYKIGTINSGEIDASKKKVKQFITQDEALEDIAKLKVKLTRLGYHQVFM